MAAIVLLEATAHDAKALCGAGLKSGGVDVETSQSAAEHAAQTAGAAAAGVLVKKKGEDIAGTYLDAAIAAGQEQVAWLSKH